MEIDGIDGKKAIVRTGWIIKENGIPTLTSAYVTDKGRVMKK